MAVKYTHLSDGQDAHSFQTQVAERHRKWPGCTGTCRAPHLAAPHTSSSLPWRALESTSYLHPCRAPQAPQSPRRTLCQHSCTAPFPLDTICSPKREAGSHRGCCSEQRSHSDTRSDQCLLCHLITATSPPGRFLKLTLAGKTLPGCSKVRKNQSNKYVNFACVFSHLPSHQSVEAKVLFI